MPIKGLSEQIRLTRLGKLHLGIKVEPDGRASYPKSTDYFVCPPEVQEVFGDEPKTLSITFPTEDPDQWASNFYRAYSSSQGLVCRGDGEVASRLVDLEKTVGAGGELPEDRHPSAWPVANRDSSKTRWEEIICPPDTCPEYGRKVCRPTMNLQFMLPDVTGLGVYQIDTSSWNSMRNILSGVRLIKGLCGRISLIPLTLSLVPREVQPESQGKKIVHILQLTAPYKLADLFKFAALPAGQALMLPAPDAEPPEDLPEGEPPVAPLVQTIDSFFQAIPDTEQRLAAWKGIQEAIKNRVVTSPQVVKWLRDNHDIVMSEELLAKDEPPASLSTNILDRLQDGLSQLQLRMEEPAG